MPVSCPNGHQSESTDYCDTCGAVIASAGLPPLPATAAGATPAGGTAVMPSVPVPASATCPNCGGPREPDETFCEVCGLNFATGQLPSPAADHRYFESNQAESPDETVTFPTDAEVREVPLTSNDVLIGRRSDSKGVFPAIDLSQPPSDPGVSRRHATLRLNPDGWVVVDQGSTNGTLVRGALTPIKPGDAVRLHDGDHLNVGAWTRITLRRVGTPA